MQIIDRYARVRSGITIEKMKKNRIKTSIVAVSVMLMASAAATAQFKIDVEGQSLVNEYKMALREAISQGKPQSVGDRTILAIVKLSTPEAITEMEAKGCVVRDVMNDLSVVEMPVAQLESVSELPAVAFVSTQKEVSLQNDKAREASGVDAIRAGVVDTSGKPLGYDVDGTGVVVGLMDTGLDPNHVNFLKSDGTSRVKGITKFTGSNGNGVKYLTPSEIADFTTESVSATHGSHVLGIMAGSYSDGAHDYSGVATGADIYVACGALYDANIILGVRDVLEYAKSVGKPAVVNLSLGNTSGSHDQYSFFGQYLDYFVNSYEPCPIITISAGNDAQKSIAIKKTFTEVETSFSTVMAFDASKSSTLGGSIDIYGDDSTPFVVRPFIYNMTDAEIIAYLEPMKIDKAGVNTTFYCYETFDDEPIPELAEYFSGSIDVQSGVASGSDRFFVAFAPNLKARTSTSFVFGFTVEGSEGHTVYAYHYSSLGTTFSNGKRSDFTTGTADGTVNGLATGQRVAVIGSYNTRRNWPNFEGKTYGYSSESFEVGRISSFSSWGTLWDGRNLPHIVAPGCVLSSSLNGYHMDSSSRSIDDAYVTQKVTANGRTNYWGTMMGTSMASPFAGGVFALWKQVNPDLTIEDAVWIAQETAKVDEFVSTAGVKAGAGKLDAEAGLMMVLSGAGVESVVANGQSPFLVKTLADNHFEIRSASDVPFAALVCSVSGAQTLTVAATDGVAFLDCSSMPKGVYVLKVAGQAFAGSRKIVVR